MSVRVEPRAYHEPVLVDEVLGFLAPGDGQLFLDGTLGGGGHTRRILEACEQCHVIAVDRDPRAIAAAQAALGELTHRVRFLHRRFDSAVDDTEIRDRGLDGALLDLGVSSHQLDEDERGFAFRRGLALDMRMDATEGDSASDFLATASEEQLARVFRELGEEPRARRLAREIVKRRATARLESSDDLVAALVVALGRSPSAQDKARIFQAVRIAVNAELESLEQALPALRDALNGGGVLVVIAYHSLEDRLVKHAFREWSRSCVCPPELPVCACRGRALGETLTRRPVRPSEDEVDRNPRARSAKLRAWRKAA
jgi:16S rRNA (cytosine1402-N4)-methyltransferase